MWDSQYNSLSKVEFVATTDQENHTHITTQAKSDSGLLHQRLVYVMPEQGAVGITTDYGPESNAQSGFNHHRVPLNGELGWDEPLGTELVLDSVFEDYPRPLRLRDFTYLLQSRPDSIETEYNNSENPEEELSTYSPQTQLRPDITTSIQFEFGTDSPTTTVIYESDSSIVSRQYTFDKQASRLRFTIDGQEYALPVTEGEVELRRNAVSEQLVGTDFSARVADYIWYHIFDRLPTELSLETNRPDTLFKTGQTLFEI